MQVRFLLFALLSVAAFGETLTGIIVNIDKNQLRVKSPEGEVRLQADDKTTVRKAKIFHDLSPLAVGDVVRVNFYGEGPNMVAVNISARVALSGVISESASMRLTLFSDSRADATDKKEERVFIFLYQKLKRNTPWICRG
jgi:hypothetical protein